VKTRTTIGIAVAVAVLSASVTAGIFIQAYEDKRPEVRVFIASSLAAVVEHYKSIFEKEYNCKLVINSGGSDTLYAQIVAGSPCDVFMAAANSWTDKLNGTGTTYDLLYNYTYACRNNFTTNKLVVILPNSNPTGKNITSLLNLTDSSVRMLLGQLSVPVGNYTERMVKTINNTWGNPSKPAVYKGPEWVNYYARFYDTTTPNHIETTTSVQDVVSRVRADMGLFDAGIAYISDMTVQKTNLLYLTVPNDVNPKATYGISVIKASSHLDLAQAFVNFWLSLAGQDLLTLYGFGAS